METTKWERRERKRQSKFDNQTMRGGRSVFEMQKAVLSRSVPPETDGSTESPTPPAEPSASMTERKTRRIARALKSQTPPTS